MTTTRSPLWRRWQEFRLIGQDPVLALGLIAVGAFVLLFVALPLLLVIWEGFFDPITGQVSLKYFTQFFDAYYMPYIGKCNFCIILNYRIVQNLQTCGDPIQCMSNCKE
jgi:hypothetical protein